MLSCKDAHCDKDVKKPSGSCANPLGLSVDASGNSKIPDSAFSSGGRHLAPGIRNNSVFIVIIFSSVRQLGPYLYEYPKII